MCVEIVQRVAEVCVENSVLKVKLSEAELDVSNGGFFSSADPVVAFERIVDYLYLVLHDIVHEGMFLLGDCHLAKGHVGKGAQNGRELLTNP